MPKKCDKIFWEGKVIHNKKSNQLMITLPRKKLKLKKKQVPKKIRLGLEALI